METVDVVDIDPSLMVDENGEPVDLADTRELTKWVRKQYQGKEVTISDDGLRLMLTRKGIESSTKKRGTEQRQVYAALDKVIEASIYAGYEEGDADHQNIERQNVYYSALRIGNNDKLYSAVIKINIPFDRTNPNYYKDHKITEIKIAPTLSIGSSAKSSPSYQSVDAIDKISLSVLKENVKRFP
jgi:hypothetical protein